MSGAFTRKRHVLSVSLSFSNILLIVSSTLRRTQDKRIISRTTQYPISNYRKGNRLFHWAEITPSQTGTQYVSIRLPLLQRRRQQQNIVKTDTYRHCCKNDNNLSVVLLITAL
jgi:hypothetical protein